MWLRGCLTIAVLFLALCQPAVVAAGEGDAPAEAMAKDAFALVMQAQDESDASRRLTLLTEANAKLDQILRTYPDSDAVQQLAAEHRVGLLSRQALTHEIAALQEQAEVAFRECQSYPTKECLITMSLSAAKLQRAANPDSIVFTSVAAILVQIGELAIALDLAMSDPEQEERCRALWKITTELAHAGDIQNARKAASSIECDEQRDMSLGSVSEAQLTSGDIAAAHETVLAMNPGISRDMAMVDVAKGLAKSGRLKAALSSVRIMEDEGLRSSALLYIAMTPIQLDSLTKMREDIDGLSNDERSNFIVWTVLSAPMGFDELVAELHVADRMETERERSQLYGEIAVMQAKAGDIGTAINALNSITTRSIFDNSAPAIVNALLQMDNLERASEIAADIGDKEPYSEAAADIAITLAAAGDMESATAFASTITLDAHHDRALLAIATAQAKASRHDIAMNTARDINAIDKRGEAMMNLHVAFATSDGVVMAAVAAAADDNRQFRGRVLDYIMSAEADVSEISAALHAALSARDEETTPTLLAALAGAARSLPPATQR
jgi:hypothetical protein